jgi:hypothetical protein
MTTTMSVTDANPEIATRNRYFRAIPHQAGKLSSVLVNS